MEKNKSPRKRVNGTKPKQTMLENYDISVHESGSDYLVNLGRVKHTLDGETPKKKLKELKSRIQYYDMLTVLGHSYWNDEKRPICSITRRASMSVVLADQGRRRNARVRHD